jgi:hypothetical protein
MEILKITGKHFRPARFVFALLAASTMLVTVSCGPQVIEGRPPFVSISDMKLDGETLATEFDISNQNGVTMTVESVEITVMVNTTLLARYASTEQLEITANSTEEVRVADKPDEFTRNLLTSLDEGRLKSLAFDLKATVMTLEDGRLISEHTGYLYPVPGRPGSFRSAVTQAKGLVRDDDL